MGPERELGRRTLVATQVNFISGRAPQTPLQVTAKIRYQALEAEATVMPLDGDRVRVVFVEAQRDITPGQGVVFYQGQVVLGGGTIAGYN